MKRPPGGTGPPDRAARDAVLGPIAPSGVIDVHSDLAPAQFGRYEVVASIGRGGMGEIYLARRRNKSAARLVALKVLVADESGDEDLVAMFIDEASIMSQIQHANVLQVFDFGREDNRYYLAMEYLAGRPLVRVMIDAYGKLGGMDPLIIAAIGAQSSRGLHAAHSATNKHGQALQVVHRDVSPQNIFVTYPGVCKVLDFGVARASERLAQTTVGQLKGKAAYMSPEQVHGHVVDRRSDVFSLGVCLWEMCAGRRLFKRDTEWETMTAVVSGPILPPSTVRGVPASKLDKVILRALERDPNKRYKTAEELAVKLESFAQAQGRGELVRAVEHLMSRLYGADATEEQGLIAQLSGRRANADDLATLRRLSGISPKPSGLREITLAGAPEGLRELDTFGAERTDPIGEEPSHNSTGPDAIRRAVAVIAKEQQTERKKKVVKDRIRKTRRWWMRSELRRWAPYVLLGLLAATSVITVLVLIGRASSLEGEDEGELGAGPPPLRLDPIEVELPPEEPETTAPAIASILGELERAGVDVLRDGSGLVLAAGEAPPVRVSRDAGVVPVRAEGVRGFLLLSRGGGLPSVTWAGSVSGERWTVRAISINDCPATARTQPVGIEISYGGQRVLLPFGGGALESVELQRPPSARGLELAPLGLALGAVHPSRTAVSCSTGWKDDVVRLDRLPHGRYSVLWLGEGEARSETLIVPRTLGESEKKIRRSPVH